MDWVKSAEISHFEAGSDYSLYPNCGDFITDLKNYKSVLDDFLHNDAKIPAFGCYGNHELELTDSLEILNSAYGLKNSYYNYYLFTVYRK